MTTLIFNQCNLRLKIVSQASAAVRYSKYNAGGKNGLAGETGKRRSL